MLLVPGARHRRHLCVWGGGRGGGLQVPPLCHGTTGGLRRLGSLQRSRTSCKTNRRRLSVALKKSSDKLSLVRFRADAFHRCRGNPHQNLPVYGIDRLIPGTLAQPGASEPAQRPGELFPPTRRHEETPERWPQVGVKRRPGCPLLQPSRVRASPAKSCVCSC